MARFGRVLSAMVTPFDADGALAEDLPPAFMNRGFERLRHRDQPPPEPLDVHVRPRAVTSAGFTPFAVAGSVSFAAWWYWCPTGEATRSV